jgi:hydroxypyruvate reductase
VEVLVMSDVEGDRLDVVSSGPLAADPTTYAEALAVLERFNLAGLRPRVTAHLRDGAAGKHRETVKPGDRALARVTHRVVASNQTVTDAVAEAGRGLGFFVSRDHRFISGGAAAEGRRIGATLRRHIAGGQRVCFIAGGEPVVNVGPSTGVGGPSQELALAAAVELDGAEGVVLAAVSTDGVDGPPAGGVSHAGAVVTGETAQLGRRAGVDPVAALSGHDSATFFSKLGAAVRTGPTGTNLNHVVVALLTPPKR